MNKSDVRLCVKAEAVKTINKSDKETEISAQEGKAACPQITTLNVNKRKICFCIKKTLEEG